jgi:3-hydroxybutyryl-CoA dehydrogenase
MDVAVLGADVTGRAVAEICARAGYDVSFHSHDATIVMDSIDVIERRLDDALDAGDIETERREGTLDRLEATTGLEAAVSDASVVIETTLSDAGALQQRFAEIEELAARETLITTGQSTVSLTAAAAGLRRPDRALGLHFHRPLDRSLVEIVVAEQTTATHIDRAESFVDGLPVSAVSVRDTPGAGATRLALALEVEAMRMVADDIASVEAVDTVFTRSYETEVGPLERADRAGLADRLESLDYLADSLDERFQPPPLLADLVAEGQTGMEAGEGFYVWEDAEPTESALPEPSLAQDGKPPDDPGTLE